LLDERGLIIMLGMVLLTVLAISYWLIMKQDGTVLTAISGIIGGAIGYLVNHLGGKSEDSKG
jgi:lipoprotein signal peptidase